MDKVRLSEALASLIGNYVDKEGLARFYTKISGLFALKSHTHTKSQISDFPTSMPANGGNAYTVNGHTVAANVPANAKFTDTIYTHPSTHPASMITTDSTHRFVTDSQVSLWNNKASTSVATQSANGLMSAADKKKVDNIASTTKTITIYSSDWQNGYYTLFDSLITATSNQEFLAPTAIDSNKAMRDMLVNAQLKDAGQGVGWAKLRCEGTVPTSTVQLRVIFRGEK